MGRLWSSRSLVRALLAPAAALLAVSVLPAQPAEAAPSPSPGAAGGGPETVAQAPGSGGVTALGRRVLLGTTESARFKQRQGAAPAAQSAGSQPLVYHGGQVLNNPQVYLSLWGSDWNGPAYQSTIQYLQGFFGNVGGSPWLNVVSQYCSGTANQSPSCRSGSSGIANPVGQLKATWVDTHAVTYNTPSSACGGSFAGDCDVMAAAARAAGHFGQLPRGAMVMVFTPSGRSQPGFVANGWCAYHWAGSGVVFGYVPYLPDAGASCGRNAVNAGGTFDGFSIVGGHEYAEAITDPFPDSGWIDAGGAENADKCAWVNLGDATLGGRPYAVQPTWSNAAGGCQVATGAQQPAPPPAAQSPPASFSSMGGTLTSQPAVSSWGPGRLDVFARGSGNSLQHRWLSAGSWSAWENVGGVLTSEPAAVSWSAGRLDVFVRGTDNALWHNAGDGTRWYGWESLGGTLRAGPSVASWAPGRLDVFVTGTDNGVWHRWLAGRWRGWEAQGGSSVSSPAAVSAAGDTVDVFTQGSDNTLRRRSWNGSGWSPWQSVGGSLAGGPAAVATGIDQIAVFIRGGGGQLYRNTWNGGAWSGFGSVGGGGWPSVSAAAVQPGALNIDLFTQGNDGALWHATAPVVT